MPASALAPRERSKTAPKHIPQMLNHAAFVTHDVAATADFYTRILGMELVSTIFDDRIPSTGDAFPYFHIFFRLGDGSTIAFFESPSLPPRAKATHPAYEIFEHFAMQVNSREDVLEWHEWLKSNGIDVIGPTDHKGIILSIYFHDPNGVRLEITTPLDPEWNNHIDQGRKDLDLWVEAKERAVREGRDVAAAMIAMIHDQRRRYDKS